MSSHGTRLRLRALVAIGWAPWILAARSGLDFDTVTRLLVDDTAEATPAVQWTVVDLFDAMSMELPLPGSFVDLDGIAALRDYAVDRGWLPPLALDEDHIDDPTWTHPQPDREDVYDEVAVWRRMQGDRTAPLTVADRREIVSRALLSGWSYKQIECVCGVTKPERYARLRDQVPQEQAS